MLLPDTAPAAAQAMEQYWLARAAFMAGDAISIADLPIACELEQLCMLAGAEVRLPDHA